MKYLFCAMALLAGLCRSPIAQSQERTQYLKLIQTIVLPGVEGRFDHMSVDIKGKRLFIAALGNETVEVIDLVAGKKSRVRDIEVELRPDAPASNPQTGR